MASKHWGPPPQGKGTPAGDNIAPGRAVGTDTLGEAVGELHRQHPHDVQGTNLPHERYNARHNPVTSGTYSKRNMD